MKVIVDGGSKAYGSKEDMIEKFKKMLDRGQFNVENIPVLRPSAENVKRNSTADASPYRGIILSKYLNCIILYIIIKQ